MLPSFNSKEFSYLLNCNSQRSLLGTELIFLPLRLHLCQARPPPAQPCLSDLHPDFLSQLQNSYKTSKDQRLSPLFFLFLFLLPWCMTKRTLVLQNCQDKGYENCTLDETNPVNPPPPTLLRIRAVTLQGSSLWVTSLTSQLKSVSS